jgi:phospholipid/cholesterol/gamma-HCH transport system ATP-binding protein
LSEVDAVSDANEVLNFNNVVLKPASGLVMALSGASVRICAGEILIIGVDGQDHGVSNPLFDLAEGMVDPDEGSVTFEGRDWRAMSPGAQSKARTRIGRVFESLGWISSLSLYENITLSQRHHTRRPNEQIASEVMDLARVAGVAADLNQRPEYTSRSELQKCQWVRAFAGSPALVLLEQPETGVPAESVEWLIDMTRGALDRGAAVVWLTSDRQQLQDKYMFGAKRQSLRNGKLVSLTEDKR